MSEADRIAVLVFFVMVFGGGLVLAAVRLLRKSDKENARDSLRELTTGTPTEVETKAVAEVAPAQREARRRRMRESMGVLGTFLARMEALGGRRGVYTVAVAVPALFLFALLVNWLLLPFPWWIETILAIAIPGTTAYLSHEM